MARRSATDGRCVALEQDVWAWFGTSLLRSRLMLCGASLLFKPQVSLDNGMVVCCDARNAEKPLYTIHAHDKAACSVSFRCV